MTNANPTPEHETWQVPQCPFTIEYDIDVMRRISREVNDGFRALPHGGLEVGGLLLGQLDGDKLRIVGHEPIACEHSQGPSFHLTDAERANVQSRIEHYASQDGRKVVGWYHAHTRSAVALTPDDLSLHYKLFHETWQVALVVQPWGTGGMRGGFFFRETGGGAAIRTSGSYREFTITPKSADPMHGRPVPSVRRPQAAAEPVTGGMPARRPDATLDRTALANVNMGPIPVPMQPQRSRWPVWTALGVMFALAIGAVIYLRAYYSPAKPASSSFVKVEARNKDGNVTVSWDPKALGTAKAGQLDIQDGPIQARLFLDERTLTLGFVTYASKSDVTGFHLRAERADGSIVEGSTTYVSSDSAAVQPPPTPASAQPEPEPARPEPPAPTPAKAEPIQKEAPKVDAKAKATPEPVKPAPSKPLPVAPTPTAPVQTASNQPQPRPAVQQPAPQQQTPQQAPAQQQQPPTQVAQTPRPSTPTPAPQNNTPAATPANNTPTTTTAAAKPVSRPAPQPPAPRPAPPPMQLGGKWVLSPGSPSQSPAPVDSVVITASDKDGVVTGTVTAKYKGAKAQNFSFSGRMAGGVARFPFVAKDGTKGEIEFVRVPGISDMSEVVWYGADVKQVYDHILRKVQ